ncbi:MAG: CPBP family intramembrane metalloprotease [Leptolyngbyaceae cyanobacterium SM1_3_5]|nr:CPBP family intramembrane metalloprotease [Leptolyngbyaceae cyanobacterium SM1_3_5]
MTQSFGSSLLAVSLITGAASLGIVAKLFIPGVAGQILLALTRVGMLVLPLIWVRWIDRSEYKLSFPNRSELQTGIGLGLLMFAMILIAYGSIGKHLIEVEQIRSKAEQIGIRTPRIYLAGAFYFTLINSLIEEFVWRWFVYQKCELLNRDRAVWIAAFCFTLHHSIALIAYTQSGLVTLLGSIAVFAAGAIWSKCYLAYRSLWSGYISHLLADLAIAIVGWHLLFEG